MVYLGLYLPDPRLMETAELNFYEVLVPTVPSRKALAEGEMQILGC